MKVYTFEQIQKFFRTVNCMGFDDFKKMYEMVGLKREGYIGYIQKQYELKNTQFFDWFCEREPEMLEKMKDAVDYIVYKRNQNPPF